MNLILTRLKKNNSPRYSVLAEYNIKQSKSCIVFFVVYTLDCRDLMEHVAIRSRIKLTLK